MRWWVYEKQDLGPLSLLAEGCGLGLPSLQARGKAAAHRGSRLRFLELKANCVSSCQPQEERHKHHLSAGACRGRLLRASSEGLKWRWPRLPGPVPGMRCCLTGLARRVPGRGGGGRAEVDGAKGQVGSETGLLFECMRVGGGEGRN